MTEVYFSFDTEDYTSDYASDAIRDEANLLHEYGIKASFNVVGYLAGELERNHRTDVLDALKNHLISFHSLRHSYHPNICEYTDTEDYETARKMLESEELSGMDMVRKACGVDGFVGAVPPGMSRSYVAMYTYADAGIPLFFGSFFNTPDGSGVHFCNLFHTDYHVCMEQLFHDNPGFDMEKLIDNMAKRKRVVVFNHPNRVLYRNFWDMVNYNGENKHPMYQWEEADRYTEEEVERYYANLRAFIERLQNDDRFVITSFDKLSEKVKKEQEGRIVRREDLPAIGKNLTGNFTWMDTPVSLSVADCFFAARYFLLNPNEDFYRPGMVHGFLKVPIGTDETVTLSGEEVRSMAETCSSGNFLPPYFEINGKRIGPADLLFAMLSVAEGESSVTVTPRNQQCSYEETFPSLANMRLKGEWIFSKDFEDRYISDRLRLQAWTIRRERL